MGDSTIGNAVRWDALTYDGSPSGRQVPSLHVYLRPMDLSGAAPADAQRLFQEILSRFYGGPPFLGAREKLEDSLRHALGEERNAGEGVQIGVAIVDPATGDIHSYRRGNVLLYLVGEKDDRLIEGDGEETVSSDELVGFGMLDGERAEEGILALGERAREAPDRLMAGGGTAGIWVPLRPIPIGTPAPAPRSVTAAPPPRPSAPPRSAAPIHAEENGRPSPPDFPDASTEPPGRTVRYSLLPFALLVLVLLLAVFWNRSNRSPERALLRGTPAPAADETLPPPPAGTLAWEFRAGAAVTSSPLVVEDRILFGSRDGFLYALRREDGRPLWKAPGPGGVGSSPALGGGRAYFGEYGGAVVAVNLETGEEIWRHATEGRVVSSPALGGDRVFVGSHDRHLYALDGATGERLWRFATGGVVWSSPVVSGDLVIFGSWDGRIYALRAESGEEVWRRDTGSRVYSSPAVEGNEVYIGTSEGALLRLDRTTGEPVWSAPVGGPVHSRPAVAEDRVVFGCEDGSVYCAYRETGEVLWSFPTGGRVPSSPAVLSGAAYVGSYDQFLYALDLDLGHPIWRVLVGSPVYSSPALEPDRLFVGTNAGRFIALSLGG
ncbi:MAG: PQQ-binding-like beta-propeller repeat protein [Candidatus Eisenbacteria bacterium]